MSGVALESCAYDGEHWGELRLLGGRQEAPRPSPLRRVSAASRSRAQFADSEVVRSHDYLRRCVRIVAAITMVSDALLGVIRLATCFRDPFRGLRGRWRSPATVRIAMYRMPAAGHMTGERFVQGADPRSWSWRAARPHRVE